MNYRYIAAAACIAALLALQLPGPQPVVTPAQAFSDNEFQATLRTKLKELVRNALQLGYGCHELGVPLDKCLAAFDKSMEDEPL